MTLQSDLDWKLLLCRAHARPDVHAAPPVIQRLDKAGHPHEGRSRSGRRASAARREGPSAGAGTMSMSISHGTHLQSDRYACINLHTGQQTPPCRHRLVPVKGNPGKGAEPLLPAEEDLLQVGHCAKQHHTTIEFPSHKRPWTHSDVVPAPTALAPSAAADGMRRPM
jgi:hypothetical protein